MSLRNYANSLEPSIFVYLYADENSVTQLDASAVALFKVLTWGGISSSRGHRELKFGKKWPESGRILDFIPT